MGNKNHHRFKIRKLMSRGKHPVKPLFEDPPVLVRNWEELGKVESDTYYIDIDPSCPYSGWVRPKDKALEDNINQCSMYLSTHTFYGSKYDFSTRLLRARGFNIQLKNWDGETIYCSLK